MSEPLTLDLGGWTVRAVETGYLWLDGGSMFGSVPKPLWSRVHPPDARNRIRLAMRCLLAEGHGRRVLVDDGIGDKLAPKLKDIYGVEDTPSLEESLAAIGLSVGDITDVVLTHLHFDHAGARRAWKATAWFRVCRAPATTSSAATGRTRCTPIRASGRRT